jgi:hypothetical protein
MNPRVSERRVATHRFSLRTPDVELQNNIVAGLLNMCRKTPSFGEFTSRVEGNMSMRVNNCPSVPQFTRTAAVHSPRAEWISLPEATRPNLCAMASLSSWPVMFGGSSPHFESYAMFRIFPPYVIHPCNTQDDIPAE